MKREIKKYLFDMKTSIDSIFEYLGDKRDFFEYQENKLLRRAVEREIEIIGEANNPQVLIKISLIVKRIIILFSIFLVFEENLYSNDSTSVKENLLGVHFGYGHFKHRAPLESFRVYGNSYVPVNMRWITYKDKYLDEFHFSYSNINLEPIPSGDMVLTNMSAKNIFISYGYHFKIFQKEKITLYAGPKADWFISVRDLIYQAGIPSQRNTDFFTSLNLSVVSKIKIGHNPLFLNANYSVAGLVTNRRYSTFSERETDLLSLTDFRSFGINATYFYRLSKLLSLSIAYSLQHYRYPRFEDIQITEGVNNQITTGLNFRF